MTHRLRRGALAAAVSVFGWIVAGSLPASASPEAPVAGPTVAAPSVVAAPVVAPPSAPAPTTAPGAAAFAPGDFPFGGYGGGRPVVILVPRGGAGGGMGGGMGLPPGFGRAVQQGPSPNAQRAHDQLLQRLGIEGTPPSRAAIDSLKQNVQRAQVKVDRPLSQTLQQLKTKPFLNRDAVLSVRDRGILAHVSIDQGYEVLSDVGARLSADRYQSRVSSVFTPLGDRMQKEWGVAPSASGAGRIAVIEGGNADPFNAATLPNGSIVVHRSVLDEADRVGAAVAASANGEELVKNLTLVVLNKFEPPPNLDPQKVQKYSNAFVAMVVGHEMTHAARFHTSTGQPSSDRPGAQVRAKETISDAGGIELAARAGYSPLGAVAVPLYFSVLEALSGRAGLPPGDNPEINHPSGIDRYAFLYRYVAKRVDAPRTIYDGVHPRQAGAPLFAAGDKAELAKLPPPEAVRQYATALAAKVQGIMADRQRAQGRLQVVRFPYGVAAAKD